MLTVGAELSRRHIPDVQRVRIRREHRRALRGCGGIPTVHGADVRKCACSPCCFLLKIHTYELFQLGVNWACTLIGLVGLVFAPSPFLFYKYGPRVRMSSKFSPCIVSGISPLLSIHPLTACFQDLKIAEQVKAEEEANEKIGAEKA